MKEKFGCEQSKLNALLNLIKGVFTVFYFL